MVLSKSAQCCCTTTSKQRQLLVCLIVVMVTVISVQLATTNRSRSPGRVQQPPSTLPQIMIDEEDRFTVRRESHNNSNKTFLYLLQAVSCLPKDLRPFEVLGDGRNLDVLVLSYRTKCTLPTPAHIEYLHINATTWTIGRNILYEASQKRTTKYLYYIFLDDDVILDIKNSPLDYGKSHVPKSINPWRKFEEFLLRVKPAVGIADSSGNQRVPIADNSRRNKNCSLPKDTEYVPSPRFDACFNAFHRKAINHLLPYLAKFDKSSWWFAGRFIEAKCEVVFPGQVVIHTTIRAINKLHRDYPKRFATLEDEALIYGELEKTIPQKYRNCSILREMRRNGLKHAYVSSTFCIPLSKPKEEIVPFRRTKL